MYRIIYFSILVIFSIQCNSQDHSGEYDRNPIIIGGYDSLIEATSEHRIMGDCTSNREKVFVQFLVSKEGSLSQIKVIKGLCPKQDSIAIEIVKSLRFKPGIEKGNPVEFKRVIGIPFNRTR